jgi:hypothetical protein
MSPLLLLSGLAAAKKSVDEAVRRTARSVIAYAVLVISGFIALGFFTAGCFLYIMSTWGAITASLIVAVAYVILGGIGFLAIRLINTERSSSQARPLSTPPVGVAAAAANRDLPASVIAVGLLAAAGYVMGRSMTRRR